jgi:hypothetical protein
MFDTLLSSPTLKRRRICRQNATHRSNPLIILLPRVHQLLDADQWDFLEELRNANTVAVMISTEDRESELPPVPYYNSIYCGYNPSPPPPPPPPPSPPNNAVKCTKRYARFESESRKRRGHKFHWDSTVQVLNTIGKNPRADAICMAPIPSRTQQALFDAQHKLEESYELENIRVLQRAIRRTSSDHRAYHFCSLSPTGNFYKAAQHKKS